MKHKNGVFCICDNKQIRLKSQSLSWLYMQEKLKLIAGTAKLE
jgi:hypothetical protein